jgi:cellulose biosynthesis protein BcsQ
MKTIAFFNNKGGVGKTTLVYHLAWMFRELGLSVVAADLDPQSNLTSFFLTDAQIAELWDGNSLPGTVLACVKPLIERLGDIREPVAVDCSGIGLLAGDLGLSVFEDRLAQAWPAGFDPTEANRFDAFRVTTAFSRLIQIAGATRNADIAVIDVGPSLGALNRAALIAADYVVVPLGADLFSLRGLRNLGPALRNWRESWQEMMKRSAPFSLPAGNMQPLGWVLLQHAAVKANEPVRAYGRWASRVPEAYSESVLGGGSGTGELALLKHYRSLAPMAQEARKPMFKLTAADGALGSHAVATQRAREDFAALARKIAQLADVPIPD